MAVDKNVISLLQEFQEEGKPDFVKELFELFVTMTPQALARIEKALQAKDHNLIFKSAHNLKSQAGNLGALKLSILCGELERLARDPSPSVDRMAPVLESISKEYMEVEKELRTLLFG